MQQIIYKADYGFICLWKRCLNYDGYLKFMETNSKQQLQGLTSSEAEHRLFKYGHNFVAEKARNRLAIFFSKFWSPVPWMLEVTIVIQLFIGKVEQAGIIAALLVLNGALSFFQEDRANKAFALLRHYLAIKTRVLRDNKWQLILAENLVPGDIVHLRMGDVSPADIRIISGNVLVDQSVLTGEALPIESSANSIIYSSALIKRGEVTGEAIATGKKTYFGKTVELAQVAKTQSHIKNIIFTIVKYLVGIDSILAIAVFVYALIERFPLVDTIPFILVLLIASVPAALPATFTLATALGAQQLAKLGVLVRRLSAIEEAAVMDIVCLDKTGTITKNQLTLAELHPYAPYTREDLLQLALLASDEATQDPIDIAIFSAAGKITQQNVLPQKIKFIPFSPDNKRTEAIFERDGQVEHVIKGFPEAIADIVMPSTPDFLADVSQIAKQGYRVLAVVVSDVVDQFANNFKLAGLLAFYDQPRDDSKTLVNDLKKMGLHIQMVTGDGLTTAQAIARQVDLGEKVCSQTILHQAMDKKIFECDVFAGVFPEDKFNLVRSLQQLQHTVGMTGDGVNDAPALQQAEVGIAVASATDVAKAAASVVLTKPGLAGILSVVEISRSIHKRMLTYILNKITKSFVIAIFLSVGVMLTKTLIITPLLTVLLLFTNDFITMSIATDNVKSSPKPERWDIANLMLGAGTLALLTLILAFAVFFYARNFLHLPFTQLQTLVFLLLVFTGQGNVYLVRERKHVWSSLPSKWLLLSTVFDIVIVSLLALNGIFMAAVSLQLIAALLFIIVLYVFVIDFLKQPLFKYLRIV
jgi:H+-transporting ATPase